MAKSKLVLFLVVGIVVLVLSLSGEVSAQETSEPTWELVETLINPENRPTEFIVGVTPGYYSNWWAGTFNRYTIEETSFIHKRHMVQHGNLLADVEMRADFTKPPEILVPGEKITLEATVSATGTSPGIGSDFTFGYRADGINLRDTTLVGTGTNSKPPFGTFSISPYFVVPETHSGEISIGTFMWGFGAANVRWIYREQTDEETCEDYCKNQNIKNWEHAIWASGDYSSGCVCECEKGWTMEDQGCVPCEDICQQSDSRAHYDPNDLYSFDNNCGCSCEGKLLEYEFGKCRCAIGAHDPDGDGECECKPGYEISVWGGKCVEKEEVVEKKTPIDKERERLKNKYPGLAPGYVLFVEGMVNTLPFRTVIGYAKYGHSALYIGDYQVTKGNEFKVRSEDAAPLRVFRDGTQINLTLGKQTKEGDVIIGAVVEARGAGIIVTTVDKVEDVAREYFNGEEPFFAWKTTYYPPTAEELETIKAFALSKVKLTEAGGLEYFPGADGYGFWVENWDCVSFVEAAFEAAGKDLTPDCLDSDISIQPQEQHDYMDRDLTFWDLAMICIWVDSPVNLHLYDSQSRHVGITPNGAFEREIPNAYYDMELEEIPQSITIPDVDDEYTLVIEAVGDGSFDLKIRDLNVRTPGSLAKVEFQDVKITKGAMGKLNIGSADNDYLMDIDDDGDGDTDRTVEPSSLETSPITPPSTDITSPSTDPSTPPCTGTSTYAYIESRTMQNEKEVRIPVMMCNANDLANMDFSISYNPGVLDFKDAEKGSLNSNSLFESNEISSGNIKILFASSKGVSGSGSIAILTFDVVGSNGDSTILTGSVNTADTSSGGPIGLTINPGEFTVGGKKTIYVDDDFTDDPANHKWNTIQKGINDANDGDTVLVYNGRYTETVVLNKRLTLIGDGMPEIDAQSLGDAINITADNCTVKGFNCVFARPSPYAGISVNSSNNVIVDNTCNYNYAGIGISVNSSNNVIADNTCNDNYAGIYLLGSSNEIRNNAASSNFMYGIRVEASDGNIISNNTVKENGITGIRLRRSNDNRITDNDVSNNEYDGISISSSNNNEVRNNVANSSHHDCGIILWNSIDNIIANNTCSSNSKCGISLLWNSNNNRIYMNNFMDNQNNVHSEDLTNIWHSPSERTYRFKGNTHTNYLGNYWDDYTGSDTDNDGIGDRSYNINPDNNDNYPLKEPVENYFLPIRLEVVPILFP